MNRIKRMALTVVAVGALAMPANLVLAGPASAHSSSVIHSTTCTGYKTVADYYQASVDLYFVSQRNLCVATYQVIGGYSYDEGVLHEKCYVNGQQSSACRWAGYVNIQDSSCPSGCTWNNRIQTSWCEPCDSTWISDSGQKFSGHWSRLDTWFSRGKGFSVDVRFNIAGPGDVLVAESDTWSGVWP